MQSLLILAFAGPLLLIGAAHPGSGAAGDGGAAAPAAAAEYPPCRPGPGDDRCIQLYERGVRASYAEWRRSGDATATRVAMGGPATHSAHHRHAPGAESRRAHDGQHAQRHDRAHATRCAEPASHAGERG